VLSLVWIGYSGLLLAAAGVDALSYRIPNWISIALAGLFVVAVAVSGQPVVGYWPNLAVGVGMFGVGYLLFALTGMGAGDAKLAAAIGLWAGPVGLYSWVGALAVGMLLLAVALVAARRLTPAGIPQETLPRVLRRRAPVPLGIALAASGVIASFAFNPALWRF